MPPAKKSGAAQAAPLATLSHHAMAPRQGEPNESYSVMDARGVETKVFADQDGVVWPQTTEQVRVADAYKLPTWHGLTTQPTEPAASAAEEKPSDG